MANIEGLQRGIKHAKKNIRVLEDAIAKERQAIVDLKAQIDSLERAEKAKAEAEANVHVDVDHGSEN